MALGVLSQAWVTAEASLPLGWQLIGVWKGTSLAARENRPFSAMGRHRCS
jgi:hypothetical protein